jgi:hypothetical protein
MKDKQEPHEVLYRLNKENSTNKLPYSCEIFRNIFLRWEILAPRPTPKLGDHLLSAYSIYLPLPSTSLICNFQTGCGTQQASSTATCTADHSAGLKRPRREVNHYGAVVKNESSYTSLPSLPSRQAHA